MNRTCTFKFMDENLNRRLLALVKKAQVEHTIDVEGVLHYSAKDEDTIGNELIPSIRDDVFSSWQILSCPPDATERYRHYMRRHDVPFAEELIDNQVCFLLARKYRPHSWKLQESGG